MYRARLVEPGGREVLQCRDGVTSIGRSEETGIADLGCSREQGTVLLFHVVLPELQILQLAHEVWVRF